MNAFNFARLMTGAAAQLRNDAAYFSSLTSHGPEKGRLNEKHLVNLLRRYLPPKYGIGTGFVVAGGGDRLKQSRQCDIIIYDAFNNVPFYTSDAWQIYPIEMVYAIVEVKTTINKIEIENALKLCSEIRAMCKISGEPNKAYMKLMTPNVDGRARFVSFRSALPPRFFIFGYYGPTAESLQSNFQELTEKVSSAHVHGFCMLDDADGVFMSHSAFRPASERTSGIMPNGLWLFLMNMPQLLISMLPPESDTFDLVDIRHYPPPRSWLDD